MYMDHTSFVNHIKLNERIIDNFCFFYNQSDGCSYKCLGFFLQRKLNGETLEKITRELQVLNTFWNIITLQKALCDIHIEFEHAIHVYNVPS